ncbi:MAG: 4-hydroxythreonine-4-phosphate dehydrogenase PdxA [Bacteroidetes bacterium RIFCSPLOWO2_12_FULL_35_15]|nr:MAG: 4-hydroxythreonine-4-phosphate dehydrogenase PdxA [Bacteroidetes bacterium RIFCSPLOWO2_12_FULL_35_15]
MSEEKIIVGISQGDINGIGLEVIIKTFLDPQMFDICTPVVFGSNKTASFHRKALNIEDFSFNQIKDVSEINHKRANIINVYEEEVNVELGKQTADGGKYALKSLEAAAYALAQGKIHVLVTAPINKENIQSPDFKFPGHTEYLDEKFADGKSSLMFLVSDTLRVAVATGHIPVTQVAQALTSEKIQSKLQALNKSLIQDFEIRKPKIAVLGLNPHAGDNGVIGNEEQNIIIPAINKMKEEGMLVYGPYSADGFFGNGAYKNFDAVLAMYHDQGLIPFKTIAFNSGVNFTAGLPIVRTSPDHGTAYDIAGKNVASEESFRRAIYTAIDIYKRRKLFKEISINPLKINPIKRER